jgi:hypothetical protein
MDGWYATHIKAQLLQMLMEFILFQTIPHV